MRKFRNEKNGVAIRPSMKEGEVIMNASRYGSLLLRTVFMAGTAIIVVSVTCGIWQTISEGQLIATIWLFIFAVCWVLLSLYILQEVPRVWLSEEGILACIVFQKQFYSWHEIQQAGILYRIGRGAWYNDLVLLKSTGSSRRYKDRTFLIRNFGKTLHLAATQEVRDYVLRHYGPLDFDLSDGQSEQSFVAN